MMMLTRDTVTVQEKPQSDMRQAIIEVLRQQESLKKKLHELLDQLGHRSQTLG